MSKFCKHGESAQLCLPRILGILGGGLLLFVSLAGWVGYQLGSHAGAEEVMAETTDDLNHLLDTQYRDIERAREETRNHIDALALKIGTIQAHLLRLDALGERLVEVGGLDNKEFDFSTVPAQGGIEDSSEPAESLTDAEIGSQIASLNALLEDREYKLLMMEDLLLNRALLHAVTPSGRPVKQGWLSSNYGTRTDPFNGKKKFHRGVDFAGKEGGDIVAVASGVVSRAEKTPGYGNLVEIRHADGYTTRYAHNKENLVSEGDMVEKGEVIALLGSTGRSNGPHVHFEVHKNGKVLNPKKYIKSR
ncbi:MAG: M23 family metallopeptidase [bacterium]